MIVKFLFLSGFFHSSPCPLYLRLPQEIGSSPPLPIHRPTFGLLDLNVTNQIIIIFRIYMILLFICVLIHILSISFFLFYLLIQRHVSIVFYFLHFSIETSTSVFPKTYCIVIPLFLWHCTGGRIPWKVTFSLVLSGSHTEDCQQRTIKHSILYKQVVSLKTNAFYII